MEIEHKRTLILNQDFRPLTVCGYKKAFLLVYLKKAELLEDDDQPLRTVDNSFALPSVIRLNKYANLPYKGVMLTRQNIFKRDAFTCQYCGSEKDLTLDHLVPRSKGGKSIWTNLVTACKRCNSKKGHYTPEASGMKLIRAPFKPSYIMFIRDFSGHINERWKRYLGKKEKLMA